MMYTMWDVDGMVPACGTYGYRDKDVNAVLIVNSQMTHTLQGGSHMDLDP